VQYQCVESQAMIDSKRMSCFTIAIIEIAGALLVLMALVFNSVKTTKLGKTYDELNLTASDYTILIDIEARHRIEFDQLYEKQKM